jgi:hypothetical protein
MLVIFLLTLRSKTGYVTSTTIWFVRDTPCLNVFHLFFLPYPFSLTLQGSVKERHQHYLHQIGASDKQLHAGTQAGQASLGPLVSLIHELMPPEMLQPFAAVNGATATAPDPGDTYHPRASSEWDVTADDARSRDLITLVYTLLEERNAMVPHSPQSQDIFASNWISFIRDYDHQVDFLCSYSLCDLLPLPVCLLLI